MASLGAGSRHWARQLAPDWPGSQQLVLDPTDIAPSLAGQYWIPLVGWVTSLRNENG